MTNPNKKYLFPALLLCCIVILSGCGPSRPASVDSQELQFTTPAEGDPIALIETSMGTIKIVLYPKYAPKAVENFTRLAENGYYNGVLFHRIVKDFIIQGGDPTGTGTGGESVWGTPFETEITDLLHNYTGAVGMASSSENGNGSQFYIVQTPADSVTDTMVDQMRAAGRREEVISTYQQAGGVPYLDYGYTVFAQVYEGMDVVDKIAKVKTDDREKPKKDVTITSVTISTYSAPPQEESEGSDAA